MNEDLDQLATTANAKLERRSQQDFLRHAQRRQARPWARYAAWTAVLLAAVFAMSQFALIRLLLLGPSDGMRRADIELVLKAAQAAVEQHRRINRTLPDRVPLAALGAVVEMRRNGDGYRLVTILNGQAASIDERGTILFGP